MVPIGMAIMWLSYTTGMWGYCLVRGYNVKFTQLFGTTWPNWKTGQATPAQIANVAHLATHPPGLGTSVSPTPTSQPSASQQLTGG
jgi:hypothetical protein